MDPPTFACGMCGKCFLDAEQVRQHIQTHTGQKPFRCIVCWPLFYDMSSTEAPQPCIPGKPVRTPAAMATEAAVSAGEDPTSQVTDRQEDVPVEAASSVSAAAVETQEVTVTPPPQHPHLASQSSGVASADVQEDSGLQSQTQVSQEKRDGVDGEKQSEPGISLQTETQVSLEKRDGVDGEKQSEPGISLQTETQVSQEKRDGVDGEKQSEPGISLQTETQVSQEKRDGVDGEKQSEPGISLQTETQVSQEKRDGVDGEKQSEPGISLQTETQVSQEKRDGVDGEKQSEPGISLQTETQVSQEKRDGVDGEKQSEPGISLQTETQVSQEKRDGVDVEKQSEPGMTLSARELSGKESGPPDLVAESDVAVGSISEDHSELKPQLLSQEKGESVVDEFNSDPVLATSDKELLVKNNEPPNLVAENYVAVHHSPEDCSELETEVDVANCRMCESQNESVMISVDQDILKNVPPKETLVDAHQKELSESLERDLSHTTDISVTPDQNGHTVANKIGLHPVCSVLTEDVTDAVPLGAAVLKKDTLAKVHENDVSSPQKNGTMETEQNKVNISTLFHKENMLTRAQEKSILAPSTEVTVENPVQSVVLSAEFTDTNPVQSVVLSAEFTDTNPVQSVVPSAEVRNTTPDQSDTSTETPQIKLASRMQDGHWGQMVSKQSVIVDAQNKTQADERRKDSGKSADCPRPSTSTADAVIEPVYTRTSDSQNSFSVCKSKDSACTSVPETVKRKPRRNLPCMNVAETVNLSCIQFSLEELIASADFSGECSLAKELADSKFQNRFHNREQNKTTLSQNFSWSTATDLMTSSSEMLFSNDFGGRRKKGKPKKLSLENPLPPFLAERQEAAPHDHGTDQGKKDQPEFVAPDPSQPLICSATHSTPDHSEPEGRHQNTNSRHQGDDQRDSAKTQVTQEMNEKKKPLKRDCELDEAKLNKTGVDFQGVISFLKNVQLKQSVDLKNADENNKKTCDKESQWAEYQPDICKSSKSDNVITASTLKESHSTSGEMHQTGSKSQTAVTVSDGGTVTVKENETVSDVTSAVPSESQTISDRNHPSTADRQAPDSSVKNTDSIQSEVTFSASSNSKLKGLSVSLARIPDSMLKPLQAGKTVNVNVGKSPQRQSSGVAKLDDVFSSSAERVNSLSSEHIHEHEIHDQDVDVDEGSLSQMWEHSNTNCTMPSRQAPLSGAHTGLPTSAHTDSDVEQSHDHEDADHSVLATFVSPKKTRAIGRTQRGKNKESLQGIEDAGVLVMETENNAINGKAGMVENCAVMYDVKDKTASVADGSADDRYTEEGKKSVSAGISESGSQVSIHCSKNQTLGSTKKRRGKSLKRVLKTSETRQVKRPRVSAKKQVTLKEAGMDHQEVVSPQQKEKSVHHDSSVNKVKSKLSAPSNANCSTEAGSNEKENSQDMNMECNHSALEDKLQNMECNHSALEETLQNMECNHSALEDTLQNMECNHSALEDKASEVTNLAAMGGQIKEFSIVMVRHEPDSIRQFLTPERRVSEESVEIVDLPQIIKPRRARQKQTGKGYYWRSRHAKTCDILTKGGPEQDSVAALGISAYHDESLISSPSCKDVLEARINGTIPGSLSTQQNNPQSSCDAMTSADCDQNQAQNEQTLPNCDQNQAQNEQTLPNCDQNQAQNEQTLPNCDQNQAQNEQALPNCDQNQAQNEQALPNCDQNQAQNEQTLPSGEKQQTEFGQVDTGGGQITGTGLVSSETQVLSPPPAETFTPSVAAELAKQVAARRKATSQAQISEEAMNSNDEGNSESTNVLLEIHATVNSHTQSKQEDDARGRKVSFQTAGEEKKAPDCSNSVPIQEKQTDDSSRAREEPEISDDIQEKQTDNSSGAREEPEIFDDIELMSAGTDDDAGEQPAYRTCGDCGATFRKYMNYVFHLASGCKKRFVCHICCSSMGRRETLTKHMRSHTGTASVSCPVCDKKLCRQSVLDTHMMIHTGEKPHKCPSCPKSFRKPALLTAHSRIHSTELPFQCDICCKAYRFANSLYSHRLTHLGEPSYACYLCSAAFFQVGELKDHLKVHSDERPFACNVCLMRFKDSAELTEHEYRNHTKEISEVEPKKTKDAAKRHICALCGSSFSSAFSMRRHMKSFCYMVNKKIKVPADSGLVTVD